MGQFTQVQDRDRKMLDSYKGMSVGEILWRTRQSRELSVSEVADTLKIRASYLEALERDDVSVLPGRVYAIGFVRSYADFLNLDGDKLVYLFKNQKVGHENDNAYAMPVPVDDGQMPSPRLLAFLFFAIILGGLFYYYYADLSPQEVLIPEVPAELLAKIDGDTDLPAVPDEVQAPEAKQSSTSPELSEGTYAGVEIRANADSWISVRDEKGITIIARLMKLDDVVRIPEGVIAKMNTGNMGALEIYYAGQKMPITGESGEVRRNINLDPDYLKSLPNEE